MECISHSSTSHHVPEKAGRDGYTANHLLNYGVVGCSLYSHRTSLMIHISSLVFELYCKVIFPCVSLSLLLLISNEDMRYRNVTRTNF